MKTSLLSVLGVCLLLGQCGLSLRLKKYSAHTRTLFLNHFINHTFAPGLGRKLGRSVRKEIHRRANFKLIEERSKAYLLLQGELSTYQKRPRLYNKQGEATHYELNVVCWIKLRENPSKLSQTGARILAFRDFSARVNFSAKEGHIETEKEALERLLRILAIKVNRGMESAYVGHFSPEKES